MATFPNPSAAQAKVFLDYTQEDLDRAYDQRVWAPNSAEVIKRYTTDSAAARARLTHRANIPYGTHPDQTLDFFPAGKPGAPVHMFIHGGAWRALTKEDSAAAAPTFVEAGINYVALNFSVIPTVRLPEMADQVRRAVVWLWHNAKMLDADPFRITISGHSSGAHLAGVLLTTDWTELNVPADVLKGAVCISGLYDMAPVMLSARSSYVKIDAAEIEALSAMKHFSRINCPVIVGHGDKESPEFQRQSREFAAALRGIGRLREDFTFAGLNHFEAPEQLNRPDTPLARAALALAGR